MCETLNIKINVFTYLCLYVSCRWAELFLMLSGRREKMRARKKNWFCLKTVNSSPSWRLCRVVWRSPLIIFTFTTAAVRKKRQRKVRKYAIINISPSNCCSKDSFRKENYLCLQASVSISRGRFLSSEKSIWDAITCDGLHWSCSSLTRLITSSTSKRRCF